MVKAPRNQASEGQNHAASWQSQREVKKWGAVLNYHNTVLYCYMDKAHQLLQFLCLWDLYRSSTLLVGTIYKYTNSDVPSINPSKRNSCEPAGGGSYLQAPSTVCARKANSCPESSLPKEVTLFPPFTKGPLRTNHIHLLAVSIHSLTMVGPSLAWPTEHHIHLI